MQATEQRLLSFPFGSACSLNELNFNVFASFHSGSSRNPSRDEGTREERLLESWTAGSWEFFWILRDWWPRKHATAAVKPYSSMLQFLISCVREKKKKKTSSPSTVKRLLAVDLCSRKVATLLLTCATVASKRSLFVFTPLVFGVAYNVIDFFFLIYHLYTFFFRLLTRKSVIQQSNFCNV